MSSFKRPVFDDVGAAASIRHLGCHAHLRRPFFQAVQGREKKAERYLKAINRLFRIERLAKRFKLGPARRQQLRDKRSRPLFRQLLAWAQEDVTAATPKTEYSDGLHYLLAHHGSLERCLTEPEAELSNNGAENVTPSWELRSR